MREAWYVPYHATPLKGHRVLVLAPHPDDEVFGCGGALAQLAAQGADIKVIIATRGQEAARRLAESQQAACILGYPSPVNWEYADRGLEEAREPLTQQLLGELIAFKADLLLAPSCWEMHPDHRAACDAALQAGAQYVAPAQQNAALHEEGARLNIALYEIGVPLSVNHLVDITKVSTLKANAMQCFESQLAEQRYADQITGLNHYRSYTLGLSCMAAEAFHIVEARTDITQVQLPSLQDQALLRCENALSQLRQHHELVTQRHQDEHAALQQAFLECQSARHEAEQMLQTIYATRGWRWLSHLKTLLGRG